MSWFSSKPKVEKREYTGFPGDTSPEQDIVFNDLKVWVQEQNYDPTGQFDDVDMLRYCRARKFDLVQVKLMFTNMINWRQKGNIDTIIDDFVFTERDAVRVIYPHGYHGTDKTGRPLYIERIGLLKVPELFAITTEERMVRHYEQEYEILMKLRYPACSAVSGQTVRQGVSIMDLTGGSMGMMNKQIYGLLKLASVVGSDYYPEIMGNLFVVNAPYFFSGVWVIVKGFLDERTRKKIEISSGSNDKKLLAIIDANVLPTFLGGTCTCEHLGGNCMTSNIGPWNEFEIMKPSGIKRKDGTKVNLPSIEESKEESKN